MYIFYFDSSALAKAYVEEKGTPIVEYILENTSVDQWRVLMLGLLETFSILVRKKNSGVISPRIFRLSLHTFKKNFIDNTGLIKVEATNVISLAAMPLIEKHSINATDSIVFHTALGLDAAESENGNELILVTADQRLVTAAKAEGLPVINPETATLAEIEKLLQPVSPPAQSAT